MRHPLNPPFDQPQYITTLFGVPDPNAQFGKHSGIDVGVKLKPVYAMVSGTVSVPAPNIYHGKALDIERDGKWYRTMHMDSYSILSGPVQEGQLIGYTGNTGVLAVGGANVAYHLHFDIRKEYNPSSFAAFIDPLTLIGEEEPMFNEGDRFNVNQSLFAEDKGYWKEFVGKNTYKGALEAIFGSPQFLAETRLNEGDLVNIQNATHWPPEPGIKGWIWKRFWEDYAVNKVTTPTPPSVIELEKGKTYHVPN